MAAGDLACSVMKDTLDLLSRTEKSVVIQGCTFSTGRWRQKDQKFKSILCTQPEDRLDSMTLSQKMKMNDVRRQHLPFAKEKSNQ